MQQHHKQHRKDEKSMEIYKQNKMSIICYFSRTNLLFWFNSLYAEKMKQPTHSTGESIRYTTIRPLCFKWVTFLSFLLCLYCSILDSNSVLFEYKFLSIEKKSTDKAQIHFHIDFKREPKQSK